MVHLPFLFFALGCNCINAALAVYSSQLKNNGKKIYWLQSLVLVIITGFGGGIIGPMLIGKPSMITSNDNIIALCILWWYLVHNIPGVYYFLSNYSIIKAIWTVGLGIFRTNAVIGVVVASNSVLTNGPYYPIPLVGPIVAGIGQPFLLNLNLVQTD